MSLLLIYITTSLIHLIIAIEMNLIAPLAPYLADYFNIKDSYVIFFNFGFSLIGLFIPLIGLYADKYGKKRSISITLISFILGMLITSLAKHPIVFGLARIFTGIGYFSLSGTTISYLSEFVPYEKRGKATGTLRFAFGLAILTSPIYATFLISKFNHLLSVYLPLIITAILCLIFMSRLPETEVNKDASFHIKELINMGKDPLHIKVLLIVFLILIIPALSLNYLGIFLSKTLNLSHIHIGYVYSIVGIGTIIGILVSLLFSDRVGKERLSKILFIFSFLFLIPLIYVRSLLPFTFLLTLMIFGVDGGWSSFQAFCSEVAPNNRGTFMNLVYGVNSLAVSLCALLGPIIYDLGGYRSLILITLASNFLAILILFQLKAEKKAIL